MITFYFIRHGRTTWNHSGRYQGITDVPLNDVGRQQANLVAERLKDITVDNIISSDLSRAIETAEAIAKPHNKKVQIVKDFQELNFGDWEGLTFEEIEKKWPGMIDEMYRHPATLRVSSGESFGDLQKRTMKAIENLIHEGENKTHVIISHGAAIRTMICGLLDIPLDRAWNFSVGNASITCMTHYVGDRTILNFQNSTDHLHGLI